jgi:hypothetical protein
MVTEIWLAQFLTWMFCEYHKIYHLSLQFLYTRSVFRIGTTHLPKPGTLYLDFFSLNLRTSPSPLLILFSRNVWTLSCHLQTCPILSSLSTCNWSFLSKMSPVKTLHYIPTTTTTVISPWEAKFLRWYIMSSWLPYVLPLMTIFPATFYLSFTIIFKRLILQNIPYSLRTKP